MMHCPYCGSKNTEHYEGSNLEGIQEYTCTDCGCSFWCVPKAQGEASQGTED